MTWWVDEWQYGTGLELTDAGQTVVVPLYVDDGSDPLRLCLTWDDPAGPAVVNPLELILARGTPNDPVSPPRRTWRSNPHAPGRRRSADESDLWNNTHIIRVPDPEPGWYTAYVLANTKPYGQGQRFALAYSGRISSVAAPWREP
jgi:hypothetical protein